MGHVQEPGKLDMKEAKTPLSGNATHVNICDSDQTLVQSDTDNESTTSSASKVSSSVKNLLSSTPASSVEDRCDSALSNYSVEDHFDCTTPTEVISLKRALPEYPIKNFGALSLQAPETPMVGKKILLVGGGNDTRSTQRISDFNAVLEAFNKAKNLTAPPTEKDRVDVFVHHIDAWNSIWVWLIKYGHKEEFHAVVKDFNEALTVAAKHLEKLPKSQVKVGAMVMTYSQELNLYLRGRIDRVGSLNEGQKRNAYVRLIDMGGYVKVADTELLQTPPELLLCTNLAHRCMLPPIRYGFLPYKDTRAEFERKLGQMMVHKDLNGKIQGTKFDRLELILFITTKTPTTDPEPLFRCVNEIFLDWGEEAQDANFPYRTGEQKILPGPRKGTLLDYDASSQEWFVAFSTKTDLKRHLGSLARQMQPKYKEDYLPTEPTVGCMVAVEVPNKQNSVIYYRGKVLSTDENHMAQVFLLDIGCTDSFRYEQLRPLDNEDTTVFAAAIRCKIPEYLSMDEEERKIALVALKSICWVETDELLLNVLEVYDEAGRESSNEELQEVAYVVAEVTHNGRTLKDLVKSCKASGDK